MNEDFLGLVDELFGRLEKKNYLGFESVFDELKKAKSKSYIPNSYPPYNIRNYLDGSVTVEIALAGFSPDEITVRLEENDLVVSNKPSTETDDESGYVHKGIAKRNFLLKFKLNQLEPKCADMKDGLLTISLSKANKDLGRLIPINSPRVGTSKSALDEPSKGGIYQDGPMGLNKKSWEDVGSR